VLQKDVVQGGGGAAESAVEDDGAADSSAASSSSSSSSAGHRHKRQGNRTDNVRKQRQAQAERQTAALEAAAASQAVAARALQSGLVPNLAAVWSTPGAFMASLGMDPAVISRLEVSARLSASAPCRLLGVDEQQLIDAGADVTDIRTWNAALAPYRAVR
jgi:hypothetical protein